MALTFDLLRVTVDNVTWTPIPVTMSCSRVVIENPGAGGLTLRVDPTDGTRAKRISPDSELDLQSPVACFEPTSALLYAQLDGVASGVVIVSYTR